MARDRWTRMPMPAAVISFMNQLANDDRFASKLLTFRLGCADGRVIELDGDGTQTEAPPIEDLRPLAEEGKVADLISIDPELDTMGPQSAVDLEPHHHHAMIDSQAEGVESEIVDGAGGEDEATDEGVQSEEVQSEEVRNEGVLADIQLPASRYNLRPRKSAVMESTSEAKKVYGLHFTLKKGREMWKVLADASVHQELKQRLNKEVWIPIKGVPKQERRTIIPSSLFFKESDGTVEKIKGRFVAGGHRQDRTIYTLEDITAPTASLSFRVYGRYYCSF